jgi:hypothetical protein
LRARERLSVVGADGLRSALRFRVLAETARAALSSDA